MPAKKTASRKRKPARKASRKKAAKRKPVARKKTSAKKSKVVRKKVTKKVSRKKVASRKKPAAKKKVTKKKASKKKVARKKASKKKVARKKAAGKKVSKKKVTRKKVAKKKASKKKVAKKKVAARKPSKKKVVRKNLELAFPEMAVSERREIERRSYRHFVDVFFEMIKSFTISEKEISKHLSITNPELLDPYYEKGQSVIFTSGHYANWEWVSFIVEKSLNYHMSVVYKKLKNKYFDNLMKKTRNKFGVRFVEKRNFYPEILKNKKNGVIQAYGFLSDQSPKLKTAKYWDTFLNIEVPVEIGVAQDHGPSLKQPSAALAAAGIVLQPRLRDPVDRITGGTNDVQSFTHRSFPSITIWRFYPMFPCQQPAR